MLYRRCLTISSMLGGFLMVAVGILYLVFEDKLLADFSGSIKPQPQPKPNLISRSLIGVQVSGLSATCFLAFF